MYYIFARDSYLEKVILILLESMYINTLIYTQTEVTLRHN